MVKTIYVKRVTEKEFPNLVEAAGNEYYDALELGRYKSEEDARRLITKKMMAQGYSKPVIEVC